ncbi:MAG: 2-phospho-L-lactate transferase [Herpetosiphonaceae bacterium]|nr:2-phospho-L-lactate transferase [Herpetosiphonaceae bacterium]
MKVLALAGGVGGAKLAGGLYHSLPPHSLAVLGNTADDFTLWGLHISPDLDTVMYTLAGLANPVTGWGLSGDTWVTLEAIRRLGGEGWFALGDQDIATHIRRTELLAQGMPLTEVTERLCVALGIQTRLLPMTNDDVHTEVDTPAGRLPFQEYFVRRQHRDDVHGIHFAGIENAVVPATVTDAIAAADVIFFCPSNPLVSIGPILAVPGLREQLREAKAPRIAVSPLIGGVALKGPADKMMHDLGFEATTLGIARLYTDLLDGLVIDTVDAELAPAIRDLGMQVLVTDTIMHDVADRNRLAQEMLQWSDELRPALAPMH